jgi:hypothetical protein
MDERSAEMAAASTSAPQSVSVARASRSAALKPSAERTQPEPNAGSYGTSCTLSLLARGLQVLSPIVTDLLLPPVLSAFSATAYRCISRSSSSSTLWCHHTKSWPPHKRWYALLLLPAEGLCCHCVSRCLVAESSLAIAHPYLSLVLCALHGRLKDGERAAVAGFDC